MTLIISDNFYTTTALHTKRGGESVRARAYSQVWNNDTYATQE